MGSKPAEAFSSSYKNYCCVFRSWLASERPDLTTSCLFNQRISQCMGCDNYSKATDIFQYSHIFKCSSLRFRPTELFTSSLSLIHCVSLGYSLLLSHRLHLQTKKVDLNDLYGSSQLDKSFFFSVFTF